MLHEDRLFPADPGTRAIARRLYADIRDLPIISPHGHTDPAWFAGNAPFADPASLLVTPDHYLLRMLYSQGVPLEALGVPRLDGAPVEADSRRIWATVSAHWHLFRGTPTRLWWEQSLKQLFDVDEVLSPGNAAAVHDHIAACLGRPEYRPRALYERFNIEVLATTEGVLDDLAHHKALAASGWRGRVITTFRPDQVTDPDQPGFRTHVQALGAMTGQDTEGWAGFLDALRQRRRDFRACGATATDHGHPTPATADLSPNQAAALFARVLSGRFDPADAELFRAQMLTEMAGMSLEDGMVMQIHAGVARHHNPLVTGRFGPNRGDDMPAAAEFVRSLRPLLARYGNERDLTIILFTLDETTYARELAPLAGHYPALRLGPPWWFHDSPEGMRRFREQMTETAGFYNIVGFNDDTRAFPSIPARHDVARRADCAFLARLVAEHRLDEAEAAELARDLAYGLAKKAYRL
ncbi:glucuronate isomerase [Niveispirillum fermenti]|uniref:glucuronate isomerase n=1 Tax=Niveispirillum fermenti TaxID=1233113 RepID=UPI003A84CC78